jgi:hypothetical protein
MPISSSEMKTVLTELNCRTNYSVNKVTEYMLPNSKEAFYMYNESGKAQLVIRPVFEVFKADFAKLKGVRDRKQYCHSSEMTRFPTRKHTSFVEVHYGLPFGFDNTDGVKSFIDKLTSIINES